MLTASQVTYFLGERLGFANWESALNTDKENFLNELIRRAGVGTHYENVTWAAQTPLERRSPTVEDVITQELETGGGACIHQNYFLKLLLDHLGFNAFVVAAEVPSPYLPVPRNHVVTIVRLQNGNDEEKLYLIDTGFGRPIPEPINLSELPFSGRAGGFNFEYRFNTELQLYERIALDGCAIKGAFEDESNDKIDYFFELKPQKFEDFDEPFHIIFTDQERTFFLNTDLIFRFLSVKSATDFEFICFRAKVMVRGTAETRSEEKFETYGAMQSKILQFFPNLKSEVLAAALKHYDNKNVSLKSR